MNPKYIDVSNARVVQIHARGTTGYWWLDVKIPNGKVYRLEAIGYNKETSDLPHITAKEMKA